MYKLKFLSCKKCLAYTFYDAQKKAIESIKQLNIW